ncbi:MAG: helix-turn-helix transcriptional regulator [Alphaproteobacteria bacterium]|nr:helix-turn-helix transcriptional regulator [Alphaproteobacteria bacterium]
MEKQRNPSPGTPKASPQDCPIFLTLSLIANKWSIRIMELLLLADGNTLRFSQVKKALPGITQRELTKRLREFETAGIVTRRVYAEMPLRVEYTLTALGRSLCDPIQALSRWAEKYGARVQQKRKEYAARNRPPQESDI